MSHKSEHVTGKEIEMKLMRRERNSVFAVPAREYDPEARLLQSKRKVSLFLPSLTIAGPRQTSVPVSKEQHLLETGRGFAGGDTQRDHLTREDAIGGPLQVRSTVEWSMNQSFQVVHVLFKGTTQRPRGRVRGRSFAVSGQTHQGGLQIRRSSPAKE